MAVSAPVKPAAAPTGTHHSQNVAPAAASCRRAKRASEPRSGMGMGASRLKSSSGGPDKMAPANPASPVAKPYIATNAVRFSSGALAKAGLKTAGPIAPHATASKKALNQTSRRCPSLASVQLSGVALPATVVPVASTAFSLSSVSSAERE